MDAGQRNASEVAAPALPAPPPPPVPGVADIDWQAPWLAHWRQVGQPLAAQVCAGVPQPQALTAAARAPVQFVAQADLPAGVAYEAHIHATGQVPTREGLHDFFNALCWMHFPLAKRRLNHCQAHALARDGVQAQRGPVRDACTVLDENAVLLQAPDAVWHALAHRRWHEALVTLRPAWARVRLWVFGHAVLEKLVTPYPAITAHVWRVPESVGDGQLDAWLADDLTEAKLATKPFVPLPVLGVPGWWAANADARFYDDRRVFRPLRVPPAPTQAPLVAAAPSQSP